MQERVLAICFCVLLLGATALAGPNAGVKVGIHVQAHEARSCTGDFPVIEGCSDIVTTYPGCGDIDVFPVFFGLAEYKCANYSLTWPVEWGTCAFTSCSDLTIYQYEFVGDPETFDPGDCIAHCNFECDYVSVAVTGFGWLSATSPGYVCAGGTPHPVYEGPHVNDCLSDVIDETVYSFCAGICGFAGDAPCGHLAADIDEASWSKIKAIFE